MKSKKHINENYVHNCGEPQIVLKDFISSIFQMGFSDSDCIAIVDFFLFHAPVLSTSKSDDCFGLQSLRKLGWVGNSDMSKLEGQLLKAANMSMFCFIKCDSIDNTLDNMNLGERVCISHPRAVLKQNYTVSIQEDGGVLLSQKETRMECLFRHIRNALAHNHTYYFTNGNTLLEDCEENGKVSARILIPKQALINWIHIVKKEQ